MVLRLGRDSFAVALIDHCSPAVPPVQVGPGVKGLSENDWVVPLKPFLGTWRSLAGGQRTLSPWHPPVYLTPTAFPPLSFPQS